MLDELKKLKVALGESNKLLKEYNLEKLSERTAEIETLTARVEALSQPATSQEKELFTEVQDLAARNARLLKASIDGTKDATDKIEAIRRATRELNTYTSEGQVENVQNETQTIEKRA